jgi:EmrB/QacA subfamily drug resistance transporter
MSSVAERQSIEQPNSDAGPADSGEQARRSMVFAAALATIFMAAIEGTIVATAMPAIVGSLGGLDQFSWIFGAYLLAQVILIPIYGRLADLHGRKPILLIGIGIFLLGSVLCGLAWNMNALIAFRAIQGIGAGALIPVSQTVVGDIYRGAERAKMQGYVSSAFGSAAILGPLVGGLIAQYVGWQAIFWINVPLGLIAATLLVLALEERIPKREHRIDYGGAVLLALTTSVLMFSLVHADRLSTPVLVGAAAAFLVLFTALLAYEGRVQEPMLPLQLYRNLIVARGNGVGAANGAIMMSIVGFLPVYMQVAMGADPLIGGVALGVMSVAWPFGGFLGSRLVLAVSYRKTATIGAAVLVTGSLLQASLYDGAAVVQAIVGAMLMGFGMGMTNIGFVIAIQGDVAASQRGAATSSILFSRIIGQAIGSAIFASILNAGLSGQSAESRDMIVRLLAQAGKLDFDLSVIQPALHALIGSLHDIYWLTCGLALLVLLIILTVPAGLKLRD